MKQDEFKELRTEIQLEAKKGIDFILGAGIIWLGIYFIWRLDQPSYEKSILTFMFGALLLPTALGLSKVFKTNWKIKDNPLQPLGLWLNFAQLIYFPFLIFVLIRYPDYFIMAYAIITGAHLFPYAWFYDETGYAVAAILISVGSLLIALSSAVGNIAWIPLFTSVALLFLAAWIFMANRRLRKENAIRGN